jgi:hypothetical protein
MVVKVPATQRTGKQENEKDIQEECNEWELVV